MTRCLTCPQNTKGFLDDVSSCFVLSALNLPYPLNNLLDNLALHDSAGHALSIYYSKSKQGG